MDNRVAPPDAQARPRLVRTADPAASSAGRRPVRLSVVGRQDAGKTTLLEVLVAHWSKLGLQVAVLKHDGHADAASVTDSDDWEKPTADTRRIAKAGAAATCVSGGGQSLLRIVRDRQAHELDALADRIDNWMASLATPLDVIAAEGWKRSDWNKVVVVRRDEDVDWLRHESLAQVRAVFAAAPLPRVAALEKQVYHYADVTRLAEDALNWP